MYQRISAIFHRHAQAVRLFSLSFLVLFVELALIRFTSAEVLYLGYFSNFVLLSAFLGIGIGFLLSDRDSQIFAFFPQTLFLFVAFVLVTHIDASWLRDHMGQLFFGKNPSSPLRLPLWFSLLVIFSLTVFLFACLGQETGRSFRLFAPLKAYSIDIAGSLAGIAFFTLTAWLGLGPIRWFLIAFLVLLPLYRKGFILNAILMGAGVIVLLVAGAPQHSYMWSPYQRIEVWSKATKTQGTWYYLAANGIGHQTMQPFGTKEPIYDSPYVIFNKFSHHKTYNDVLIIGAGSGTDVDYALHYGAKRIDAVEIDPTILQYGKALHPDHPYQNSRVTTYVDDGRAFLRHTHKKYDLIIYALPDSLASISSFANIRLESFLFTLESFRDAKSHLRKNGILVLYNYYRKAWLVDKLTAMLTDVFGHPPVTVDFRPRDDPTSQLAALGIGPNLGSHEPVNRSIRPATDDWPFLYMQKAELPMMYIGIMLLFIVSGVAGVFLTGHGHRGDFVTNATYALMGASFLLLETKSIIQFSLLFGATWIVNSLVFFAILLSVLLANFLVLKFRFKGTRLLFAALFISLIIQYAVKIDLLLQIDSVALRYLVASTVFFAPIFLANLVFGSIFRTSKNAGMAFGWNIIGTMVGGALEYTSLAIGYRALTLVIVILYLGAMLFASRAAHGKVEQA